MKMCLFIYQQSTGKLWDEKGNLFAVGYSGKDDHKNNPDSEALVNLGPIPRGLWSIDGLYNSKRIGPHSIILNSLHHDARGRTYFRIHGDNADNLGNSSKGCIILSRSKREELWSTALMAHRCAYLMVIR